MDKKIEVMRIYLNEDELDIISKALVRECDEMMDNYRRFKTAYLANLRWMDKEILDKQAELYEERICRYNELIHCFKDLADGSDKRHEVYVANESYVED